MTDPVSVLIGAGTVPFGALIAGGFSLLVPHLQTRRDHARWLRGSRLTAYTDYLAAIDLWMDAGTIRWLEAAPEGAMEWKFSRRGASRHGCRCRVSSIRAFSVYMGMGMPVVSRRR